MCRITVTWALNTWVRVGKVPECRAGEEGLESRGLELNTEQRAQPAGLVSSS